MDVKTAFLNESLDGTTYIVHLEGSFHRARKSKCANCKSPFMDLSRHQDLGISNFTNRSSHLDLSNVLMNLVCTRGAVET